MPHQNRTPAVVGTPGVKRPVAGVLNPHSKRVPGGGGAGVGDEVGEVGADVGGTDEPWLNKMVSIEMSPVNEVDLLAVHFTDVVPAGSSTKA
jgi:hypothetical protein